MNAPNQAKVTLKASLELFRREPTCENALELLAEARKHPRLLKPVVALIGASTAEDQRLVGAIAELGLGAIHSEEVMQILVNQLRSTHVDESEFDAATIVLDCFYSDRPVKALYQSFYRHGSPPTLDGISILLSRADNTPWARRRLIKDWRLAQKRGHFTARHLDWLPNKISEIVGTIEPPYFRRLCRNTLEAVTDAKGSLGLVSLLGVAFALILLVATFGRQNNTTGNQVAVENQPTFQKKLDEAGLAFDTTFQAVPEKPVIVVLPNGMETHILNWLCKWVPNAEIIGPSVIRSRLNIASIPNGSVDWMESMIKYLFHGQSLENRKLFTAKLRLINGDRPVVEVIEVRTGRVHVFVVGTTSDGKQLKRFDSVQHTSFNELLKMAERSLEKEQFSEARRYLILAKSAAETDQQHEACKAIGDQIIGAEQARTAAKQTSG